MMNYYNKSEVLTTQNWTWWKNYIWVIILKTSQNCHIEGKNETCEFFYVILWK